MSTLLANPNIKVDGDFSDWVSSERIDNPGNSVPGYELFGTVQNDTYYIGVGGTLATDPAIGAGTTIWLNTDQNPATGYSPFDSVGADYNITFVGGSYYLYTGAAAQNLVSSTPLTTSLSADSRSLEIAVPRSLLTPAGGSAPASINIDGQIDTGTGSAVYLPSDYNNPEYTITDPATLSAQSNSHKVAIVYSDTSAKLYFSQTAYSDLFMAAQNQARMAGVSYDVIDESQLTDINNLTGYAALIFPSMSDVNTAQLPAIMSTLTSAVYNYHIGIITAGDFLTNDQNGAPLPGNPYANMESLVGLARYTGGNSSDVTATVNDASNPIMQSYTAGQTIHSYTNEGYAAYQGVNTSTDVLVNQNVTGVGTLPGVTETATGGTNVHFATTDLEGDSNLLSNAIQNVVLGTNPGVTLHISREAGIIAARMDMDQSQYPADVSPAAGGAGIYDTLIPILQQWHQQYNFVGSYFINVGDNPSGSAASTTDWSKNLPYYQAILATGGEIGNHSYTHLINPPTETFTAMTVGDTPAGSIQIKLNSVPSFAGVTVGMIVSGAGLGASAGESTAITQVTAVDGDTITISYVSDGYGAANDGTLADIPAGSKLTFSIPAENINFLQTGTGTVPSGDGNPFTYDYEFNQSKIIEQQQLGTTIYGAAIPGANETYASDKYVLSFYQSAASTGTASGYTGYLTGGWTGIGSGYPSAFGYMSPSDTGSVYLAPNMTFDFTEIQYEGKSIAQAEADWAAQLNALSANSAGTPVIVWPIHDYGAAAWNTTTDTGTGSPYTTQLYTDFIAQAAAKNYEFVTLEDLAARIEAQQKASINYTVAGSTITATVTPDPTAPNLGAMALDVINGGTNVIENVTNWYAYSASELFLPSNGGSFTVNLGATQDDVTHIDALPMRADLLSVTGDGLNLSFSMTGSGDVRIDLGNYGNMVPVVTGATIASMANGLLDLVLTGSGIENVTLNWVGPPAETVSTVAFSADTGVSATDFITLTAAQTITGTLSAPLAAGDVVKLSLDNGATWQTATAATGGTTFSLSGVALTGSGNLIAEVQNAGGTPSTPLMQPYVLDQVPPVAPGAPDLIAASDGGVSNSDNLTNVTAPTFIGSGAEAGSSVTLLDGAIAIGTGVAAADGTWSVTATTVLSDGVHSVSVTDTDLAGNVSLASPSLALTIDTVAPAVLSMPDLATLSDSGKSSIDNITNIAIPNIKGTASASTTVVLYDGTTLIGSGVSTAAGAWTITASKLSDGAHSINAKTADAAGNYSVASPALAVTIDTMATVPSTPDMTAATDLGTSNTDNITSDTTPAFSGTSEAGSTVTMYDGATKVGTGVAGVDGAWTITTSSLASGTHSITARETDVAGNVSVASAPLAVVIDKIVATPSRPVLATSSDSGVSNTDHLTNVRTPTFTGTAEAGSVVTLFDGSTAIATATASASGAWSIVSTPLADGIHNITDKAVDAAGNSSTASPVLAVTTDTQHPVAPSFTGGTVISLLGKGEAGDTVTVSDGSNKLGTATVGGLGNWNMLFIRGTAPRVLTAVETDRAGNVSSTSQNQVVMGTSAADKFVSVGSNSFFIGGAGADSYLFGSLLGQDIIADFVAAGTAHDVINFHGNAVLNSFGSVLSHITTVGSSAVISLDNNNSITLNNVSKLALTAADFTFA